MREHQAKKRMISRNTTSESNRKWLCCAVAGQQVFVHLLNLHAGTVQKHFRQEPSIWWIFRGENGIVLRLVCEQLDGERLEVALSVAVKNENGRRSVSFLHARDPLKNRVVDHENSSIKQSAFVGDTLWQAFFKIRYRDIVFFGQAVENSFDPFRSEDRFESFFLLKDHFYLHPLICCRANSKSDLEF